MKNFTKHSIAVLVILAIIIGAVNCTKHNQVIGDPPAVALNTDTLYSVKGTANLLPIGGTAWDGTIEAAWTNAPKLTVHAVVPDLGNGTFTGFIGNATDITMRSMYDATNIYLLVEWNSDQKNCASSPWYFNPATSRWAQEASVPVMNADSTTFRPPFIQDQFVMMFNIANSCPSFNSLSCYTACHVNSSYGSSKTPPGGVMYTNGPTEFLDVWRARMLQVVNANQANDCYIWNGAGALDKNEVASDPQAVTSDGGFSNKQTLKITGTSTKVSVPMWLIPNATCTNNSCYANGCLLLKDTLAGGAAVRVTKVDSFGVLTLANGTKIDPTTATSGTAFQQVGTGDGPYCIPGSIVSPYTGSRADVTANAFWTGTGWRLLLKRALKTTDAAYDVDLSSLSEQPFGVGVMFNGADNEHAIVAGLRLHFKN
jgi:hypothetical protein